MFFIGIGPHCWHIYDCRHFATDNESNDLVREQPAQSDLGFALEHQKPFNLRKVEVLVPREARICCGVEHLRLPTTSLDCLD